MAIEWPSTNRLAVAVFSPQWTSLRFASTPSLGKGMEDSPHNREFLCRRIVTTEWLAPFIDHTWAWSRRKSLYRRIRIRAGEVTVCWTWTSYNYSLHGIHLIHTITLSRFCSLFTMTTVLAIGCCRAHQTPYTAYSCHSLPTQMGWQFHWIQECK